MLPRIRTIKPEFFRHEDLYDLESQTSLPVRISFIGLWCCCDREGRFQWRPRTLKALILPFADVDFSRVLHALSTRGFIVKYACGGEFFGYIPSWSKHQQINNRESRSVIPEPTQVSIIQDVDTCGTRAAREGDENTVSLHGNGNGNGNGTGTQKTFVRSKPSDVSLPEDFVRFWQNYPRKESRTKALSRWKNLSLADRLAAYAGIERWKKSGRWDDRQFVPLPLSYLNARRWEDEITLPTKAVSIQERINANFDRVAAKHTH